MHEKQKFARASRQYFHKHLIRSNNFSAMALPSNGGTAFPICTHTSDFLPENANESGKLCRRASSLGVNVRGNHGWQCTPPWFSFTVLDGRSGKRRYHPSV